MKRIVLLFILVTVIMELTAQIDFKTEYFGKSSYRLGEGDKDEKWVIVKGLRLSIKEV